jgi:hypothetical protein
MVEPGEACEVLTASGLIPLLPEEPHDPQHDASLALREPDDLPELAPATSSRSASSPCSSRRAGLSSSRSKNHEEAMSKTSASADTCLTDGSGILPVLIPSTSSSVRSPALERATSAFV